MHEMTQARQGSVLWGVRDRRSCTCTSDHQWRGPVAADRCELAGVGLWRRHQILRVQRAVSTPNIRAITSVGTGFGTTLVSCPSPLPVLLVVFSLNWSPFLRASEPDPGQCPQSLHLGVVSARAKIWPQPSYEPSEVSQDLSALARISLRRECERDNSIHTHQGDQRWQ